MEQKGRFWKSREERQRDAEEQYSAQIKYKRKLMKEQEKWAEKYQGYPDIQIFFQQMMKWQKLLVYLGMVTFITCIVSFYVYEEAVIYGLLFFLIYSGVSIYFKNPMKAPYGLLALLAVVAALNLLPFWYYDIGDSSFSGFLAGIGALLLKAGVSLPEAMEDYTFYILWMYGIGFIVQGVIVTVYYVLAGIFVVKMLLPKSRATFMQLDRISFISCRAKGDLEEGYQEVLPEERIVETSKPVYTDKQKERISATKKFMEIYEEHPDIGRYMEKRCVRIRIQVLLGVIFHGVWMFAVAWELPARTWIFSLIGFVVTSVAMYACMSEKPERAYILFAVIVTVIALNLLPFVHYFIGDTVIYFAFYALYILCRLGGTGGPELVTLAMYGETEVFAYGFMAGIFYFWTLVLAVKMVRPKEMNMVKRLKELSDNWQEN